MMMMNMPFFNHMQWKNAYFKSGEWSEKMYISFIKKFEYPLIINQAYLQYTYITLSLFETAGVDITNNLQCLRLYELHPKSLKFEHLRFVS